MRNSKENPWMTFSYHASSGIKENKEIHEWFLISIVLIDSKWNFKCFSKRILDRSHFYVRIFMIFWIKSKNSPAKLSKIVLEYFVALKRHANGTNFWRKHVRRLAVLMMPFLCVNLIDLMKNFALNLIFLYETGGK